MSTRAFTQRPAPRHPRRTGTVATITCLALSCAVLVLVATGAGASNPRYRPPVDAPVSQGFHLGANLYGPGNRGLDYATTAGTPVRAIGGGIVVFAGVVAGSRFVTVLHPDGLRSSYSYLQTISVHRGDSVARGATVGLAGTHLQLGVRRGIAYIDPAPLLGAAGPAHLVPPQQRSTP